MHTPKSIRAHSSKYQDRAWEQYTPEQLSSWAINLTIRATHRNKDQKDKIEKDILDGRNYFDMLRAWMDHMNHKALTAENE